MLFLTLAVYDDIIQLGHCVLLVGTWCIRCWNVGRAPRRRNASTRYCYKPSGVEHAVFSHKEAANGTCQYPLVRSRVLMYRTCPNRSLSSSTLGMGYVLNKLMAFTPRKSLQKSRLPSGLGTNTMGLQHVLWDSSMTPSSG